MKSPTTSTLRVGVWIRVSTPDQAQGESPEHHLMRGQQYAAMNNWTVVETYDLAGVSGKTVWEHAECQRMLKDVKRGHIHGLIFSKLARLARNTRELLDFAEYFQTHDAHLISLEEKFDTSSPAGRLFFTFIGAIASWEREEIASRVKASITVRAKLGKPLGSKAPYGFLWKSQKLVADPTETEIRRLAFELFIKHQRKGVVARMLSEKGYRSKEGNRLDDKSIHRMLTCASAIGQYQINRFQSYKDGRKLKPEEEWGVVECTPIVSEDVFSRVGRILEAQFKPAHKPGKKPAHVFAGLLKCGCGSKMYVYTRSPNYTCMKCKNKISIASIDTIFLGAIEDELTNPQRLGQHLQRAKQKIREREAQLSGVRKQIEQIKAEMRKIYELYLAGAASVERFKIVNDPLETRLTQLSAEHPKIEGEITALQVNDLSSATIAQEAKGLATLWPTLETEEKQRLAAMMCTEIIIPTDPNDEIQITLTTAHSGAGWNTEDDPPDGTDNKNGGGSGGGGSGGAKGGPHISRPSHPTTPTTPEAAAPRTNTPSRIAPPSERTNAISPQGISHSLNRLNYPHNLEVERRDTSGKKPSKDRIPAGMSAGSYPDSFPIKYSSCSFFLYG